MSNPPNSGPGNAPGSNSSASADIWSLSGLYWTPSIPTTYPSVQAPYSVVITPVQPTAAVPPTVAPAPTMPASTLMYPSGTYMSAYSPSISSPSPAAQPPMMRVPATVMQNPYTYQFPQLGSASANYMLQQQQQALHPHQTDYWQQWLRQQQLRQSHADEYQKQIDKLKHQQQQPTASQSNQLTLDSSTAALLGLSNDSISDPSSFLALQKQELARYEALKEQREKLLTESKQISESAPVVYPIPMQTDIVDSAALAAAEARELAEWNRRVELALECVLKARASATRGQLIDCPLWQMRHQGSSITNMTSSLSLSSIAFKSKALGSSRGLLQPVENRLDSDWLLLAEPQQKVYPSLDMSGSMSQNVNVFSSLSLSALLPAAQSQELYSMLYADKIDLDAVKRHCHQWGLQKRVRAFVWQLLLGYLPSSTPQQSSTLRERRLEYYRIVESTFVKASPASGGKPASGLSKNSRIAFNLVAVDVPRTHPDGFQMIFDTDLFRGALERVLFVWAEQHSAVSYFQGLNDLAATFFTVFLHAALPSGSFADDELVATGKDVSSSAMQQALSNALLAVEPDVYWCMCRILDQLSTRYSFNRGGVYSEQMVRSLEILMTRIRPELHHHIKDVLQLDYLYFAFRWMLCLFIRELSPRNLVLLWDAFVLEGDSSNPGFAVPPLYIAAAYLLELEAQIMSSKDSSSVLFILQKAPTQNWTKLDVHRLCVAASRLQANFPLTDLSQSQADSLRSSS